MVSLSASVAWWARTEPERTALVYEAQRVSFGDLQRRVEATAGLLAVQGVQHGDVVALLMKNSAAFIELALAISHVGAVLLPINYRLGADEVAYILDHAGAVLLFCDEELEASAGMARRIVVSSEAQADSSVLAKGCTPSSQPHACQPDDLYRLMYTSGTTDRPKGVMHTYSNVAWKCFDHIATLCLKKEDRLLIVGPMYHVGAFDLPGLAVMAQGGMLAVLRDFEPEATLSMIQRERITGGWMAPVMLNRLLVVPQRDRFDLSSFQWLIGGGEKTPEERIRDFGSLFQQARYIDAYGLTETCSGDTMMEAGREIEKIGSTGRALAHVQIAVMDDLGQPLPAGAQGEVCLRGPKVTRGYWKDMKRTTASFFGDWFRTGDIGLLDEEGFLYLTDRKKDMIISGGENIASSEVERVLYQLPQVAEVAVIGLPDERWGERVAAVVVLRPGSSLTYEEVRAHCDGKLGGFKTPKELIVVDALPRNPSGKVLKRVLRHDLTLPT
ncbi:MAG: AMP-binding protein [Hydrogenophaga sp.]|uniref:AMP-binding protein n=1 Tax=Hydrogenophaga sp. TaxID=1904254 RepID=UPI002720C70F|nr:AMP-binding protein [Hydrogenophaga sp.]MDO9504255.1 AMP-binding protein [Hydrogenophaga sp.]MDZ4283915.1 AMP-binding protein [Hydrogenophaga sp.]